MKVKEWKKIEGVLEMWDFEKNPNFEGIFVSKRENVGANNATIYEFEIDDGSMVGMWGNTILDTRLKNVKESEGVKIEYLGKTKSEKTKREYRNYEVYHGEVEEDIEIDPFE